MSLLDCVINYDYLVIVTGYTSRLYDQPDTVGIPDHLLDDQQVSVVLLKDDLWGTRDGKQFKSFKYDPTEEEDEPVEGATLTTSEDVLRMRRFIDSQGLDGVIVYKNASIANGFGIIGQLQDLKYCAFCDTSTILSIKTCVFDEKIICGI